MIKPRRSIALAAGCAAGVGVLTHSYAACAAQHEQCPNTNIFGNPPVYFPYPPGLIPPDLCSEVKRVQREVDVIFKQTLAQWHALRPPTPTGQPPILQGSGYQAVGKDPKLRSQHVGRQGYGLQFLPYAIHRIHGTNSFSKSGTYCHAGVHALPMGQAQASVL